MKKEITIEIKRKIFSLYLGQKVRVWPHLPDSLFEVGYAALQIESIKDSWLSLKGIDNVSDMHAATVAEILGFPTQHIKNGKAFLRNIFYKRETPINFHPLRLLEVFDFLRSRGYALPYRNFSVLDLIQGGVFQIQKT